jgi:hypothetical protein
VGKGEGGKNQRVGQLLWMGIRHHEQDIGFPNKSGISLFFQEVQLSVDCILCKYKRDPCVQVKNKPCVECTIIMHLILGTMLVAAKHV